MYVPLWECEKGEGACRGCRRRFGPRRCVSALTVLSASSAMRSVLDAANVGGVRARWKKQVVDSLVLARSAVGSAAWIVAGRSVCLALAGLRRAPDEKECFASSRPVGGETERFQELNDQCNFRVRQDTEES